GLVDVRCGLRGVRATLEGPPASEELVRDHPEGVAVAGRARGLAPRLFRSEVARGAHDRSRQGHPRRVLDRASDPEVGHLELAALVEEQIRRLYVAMDDSALVGGVDRLTGLREPVERLRGRH